MFSYCYQQLCLTPMLSTSYFCPLVLFAYLSLKCSSGLRNYIYFYFFLLVWWLFIHLRTYPFSIYILLLATLLTNIYLILMLFNEKTPIRKQSNNTKLLISLLYIGGGCIFVPLIYKNENSENVYYLFQSFFNNQSQITMIGLLSIIWASDTFAYLTGKAFGKHKLFERVSPKKTIEGFLGGLVGAMIIATTISYSSARPLWQWLVLAVILVVTGTLGDLVESSFKRAANVKDSGTILPGHGCFARSS